MRKLSYVYQYMIVCMAMAIIFYVLDIIFNKGHKSIEFILFLSFVFLWCDDKDRNREKSK